MILNKRKADRRQVSTTVSVERRIAERRAVARAGKLKLIACLSGVVVSWILFILYLTTN